MGTAVDVQGVVNLAPLASPLAPVSKDDVFTEQQWTTLFSLLEVFMPSIRPPSTKDDKALHPSDYEQLVKEIQLYAPPGMSRADIESYLAESVTSFPEVKESLRRRFLQAVDKNSLSGLVTILGVLNTTPGSLVLTGSTTPIQQQPIAQRTVIIRKWANSYIPTLRKLHNTFAALTRQSYVHHSSKFYDVIGYKGHFADVQRKPTYAFKFIDFNAVDSPSTLETDVIVIGSGPGAAAVTNRLAAAGMKCVVVDKGYHFSSDHFPMKHSDAQEHLYEGFGAVVADDGSIATAAGSTFGGGGTVNWLATLQPPGFVRQQWSDEESLPQFIGQKYQDCFDYVCDKMGAARSNDHEALGKIKHNYANNFLLEGARKVGLDVKVVPQNTGGKVHDCGHCHLGCPSCTKQGPANLWFPEAAETGNAQFVVGFWAEKVLFAEDGVTAVGVKGTWTSQDRKTTKKVTINAKRVIVSSGTVQSPLLLKRSGLTSPWIGKNFHMHPVWFIFATMAERIDPWQGGGLLTSVVTSLRHGTGDHYGPVIEICMGLPTQTGLPIALNNKAKDGGAAQQKIDLAKLGHTVALFSMVRDKDSGEVYQDKNNPRMTHIKYTTSQRDKEQILVGQIAAARVAYAMGPREISALHPDIESFVPSLTASQEINDQAFELWLEDVKTKGITHNSEPLMLHSAHQFGTCKMSGRQERGVVDGSGKVWGCKNLWVADSSVLPTATGVNPMVSTMGTADFIARGIEKEWKEERTS